MRQHQIDAVLAELGEHRGEAQGGEVLELVEVDVKVAPLVFRNFGATETGEPDVDQDSAHELVETEPGATF
jgi:hypothetical protein